MEELFELCKEVYEKTGLDTETGHDGRELYLEKWYWTLNGKVQSFAAERYKLLEDQVVAPLYTSDYLLEKLGDNLEMKKFGEDYLFTKYVNDTFFDGSSDTPTKALLKLTLALHEVGELK